MVDVRVHQAKWAPEMNHDLPYGDEAYEERAGILEFEAGLHRKRAEEEAKRMAEDEAIAKLGTLRISKVDPCYAPMTPEEGIRIAKGIERVIDTVEIRDVAINRAGLQKIISGGQTGVDRAALDFSISIGLPHGGYCPKGRACEDGVIPDKYKLVETETKGCVERTKANVFHSDGTLILTRGPITIGSMRTLSECQAIDKRFLVVDVSIGDPARTLDFITRNQIRVLNIAASRESGRRGIYLQTLEFLRRVFKVVS